MHLNKSTGEEDILSYEKTIIMYSIQVQNLGIDKRPSQLAVIEQEQNVKRFVPNLVSSVEICSGFRMAKVREK